MQEITTEKEKLTPTQRQVLPIVAAAKSVNAGVEECVAKKLLSERTFWNWWALEDGAFRSAVEIAREEHQAAVVDRVRERARADLEQRYEQLAKCCEKGGETGQVQAIKAAMLLAGVKEFAANTVNVSTKVGVSYAEKLERGLAGRGLLIDADEPSEN